jgi:steroid 5-alpha reductase family enzyme
MSALEILAAGQAVSSLLMALAWFFCKRLKNASYVDALWAYGVGVMGIVFICSVEGDSSRKNWVIGLLALWSLRLGTHLLKRCRKGIEDSRYRYFRRSWRDRADYLFFLFFQKQAFWVVLFAAPFLIVGNNSEPMGILDFIGISVWTVGFIGGGLADRQLANFKNEAGRKTGDVCSAGLWRLSRHPNYFFEWVLWCSYPFLGWQAANGSWLLLLPILLIIFLLKVTGIPHVEARKLEASGRQYKEYMARTSAFIPWVPRKAKKKII